MIKLYIKDRKRSKGHFQYYMVQFVEAVKRQGVAAKKSYLFNLGLTLNRISVFLRSNSFPRKGRKTSFGHGTANVPTIRSRFRCLAMAVYPYIVKRKKRKAIIIASRGETLFMNSFPFFYHYEIIPMLWDVWPATWASLYDDLRLLKCKTVFVTVKTMAEKLSCELGINACWIPEGIEISDYRPGDPLSEREIDVYELGRQKKEYHEILERLYHNGDIAYYKCNRYDAKGMLKELAFPTSAMLLDALPQCKIIVSFPQVDTHPEKAGKLDTLTQRYWEAMLSRCLLLGRAPIELIELVGYNPVIDIDWESADSQIIHILAHIADYQELVDKNYAVALEHASWDKRVYTILDTLTGMGYTME